MERKILAGSVPYVVARPLIWGLEDAAGIELTRETPSSLVSGLREGRLDVALASSIEVFRTPGVSILPETCIAADGEVVSVRLFLNKPLEEISSIALDPASETANTLVRILAADFWKREVQWTGDRDGADAYLLIGDAALRGVYEGSLPSLDLGAEWKKATGLPFVYALWIIAAGKTLPHGVVREFHQAAREGVAHLEQIALEASEEWKLPLLILRRYLKQACHYKLTPEDLTSLKEFRDRAARLDLCSPGAEMVFS